MRPDDEALHHKHWHACLGWPSPCQRNSTTLSQTRRPQGHRTGKPPRPLARDSPGGRVLVPGALGGKDCDISASKWGDSNKQLIKSAHIFKKEPVSATKASELYSHSKSSFVLSQRQTRELFVFLPRVPRGWESLAFYIAPERF